MSFQTHPKAFMEWFDRIIRASEYSMANMILMKRQYQDLFDVNEKEKQKEEDLDEESFLREELHRKKLWSSLNSPTLHQILQLNPKSNSLQGPERSATQPCQGAPQWYSNFATIGHTQRKCPNPSVI
ncbi:uncharacterized protein PADG_11345 [Paracoccidioides brasiliensis Pb18]|uniref:Uncharacterized protein n=1 Tax=Paracoccidioides brasiliensis (strain Pb18) TaxID=502780 RepID=A0A0A0HTH5_PARBD|nr:uncharacterized protein PADG_11345 [Paracoccidioides brasiliensis Pb18]KGM92519.1 hypothetical protein PADG_11345 [Paracoccidioides brasiliensis Pb18]